jgi:hypothetical protein
MTDALEFARVWRRPAGAWLSLILIAWQVMAGSPDVAVLGVLAGMWAWDNASRTAERIGTRNAGVSDASG